MPPRLFDFKENAEPELVVKGVGKLFHSPVDFNTGNVNVVVSGIFAVFDAVTSITYADSENNGAGHFVSFPPCRGQGLDK